jgi:phosphinothricin acetyltransferase
MITIRPALLSDAASVAEIYNEAILHTTATFDTVPKSVEDRQQWLLQHHGRYLVLCAVSNQQVVGFAALSPWSNRCAYRLSGEVSIYVAKASQGKGIGQQLLGQLLNHAENSGLHYLLARITEGNRVSLYLHEKFGFRHIGIMTQVGYKFGRFLNVHLLEKVFFNNPPDF